MIVDSLLNEPTGTATALRDGPLLRGRKYALLLGCCLGTLILLPCIAELGARAIWPEVDDACQVHDIYGNSSFRPNCVSLFKAPETPLTQNAYNECGYRTNAHCGPKASEVKRIVMLGSSFVHGRGVPYNQTFASITGSNLQHSWVHSVEIENVSAWGARPIDNYRRLKECLQLQPDALVWVLAPRDLYELASSQEMRARDDESFHEVRPSPHIDLPHAIRNWIMRDSRVMTMLNSMLMYDPATYTRVYLATPKQRRLLVNMSDADWRLRFSQLQLLMADMSSRLQAAHVPFFVVGIPLRIEAALMKDQHRPADVDPLAFSRQLSRICQSTNATYIDLFKEFAASPYPERLFFTIDEHFNKQGNAVVARRLTSDLERGLTSQAGAGAK